MMKLQILFPALLAGMTLHAQEDSAQKLPFEDIDLSWANGNDRRTESIFKDLRYFTPSVMIDLNYKNARARFMTQFGTRSVVVPRNDVSPYKGQYQLANVYRYLSEAYAGYHFNKWYGINVDAGLFMSYIGLNSFYQCENWEYQASFTSDNTPWFFNGVRVQIHPTKHLKIEPWVINGWQSYGRFNSMPGIGGNITWNPTSNFKLITNNYYGTDAAGLPDRKRFHSDNSVLVRYFNRPASKRITRAAFSLTGDIGFEKGGGVNRFKNGDSLHGPAQYFASCMFYN